MAQIQLEDENPQGLGRLIAAGGVTLVGLTLINLVFSSTYLERCHDLASWKFCEFSVHFGERAIAILVIFAVYCFGRGARCAPLFAAARGTALTGFAIPFIFLGALSVLVPAMLMDRIATDTFFVIGVSLWALGAALLAMGAIRLIAPLGVWCETLKSGGVILAPLLALGMFLPEIGDTLFPLWHLDAIRNVTFDAVVWASHWMGLNLQQWADEYILGQGDFFVRVNQSCSGIEGFVMTTVFLLGYTVIFSKDIIVARVLAMLPVVLFISWVLNVTRIAVLIWLGVNVSPTLAVEGFHSHAGWLMFSVLSLGMMTVLHLIPWFHKKAVLAGAGGADRVQGSVPEAPLPPLSEDWNVARILPFAVFMFSALLASTFFEHPALAYPFRLVLMIGALWICRKALARLAWRLDSVALLVGLGIGLAWILTSPAKDVDATTGLSAALAGLSGLALTVWVVARILGTAVLVPVIEELFFRSYLLEKLIPRNSTPFLCLGIAMSTAAFAILHDRWLAAGLAGLLFTWLALRPKGRVEDAIVAHMAANASIALAALLSGEWALI